ncbi:MAG TPA: hypothetical protein EYP10_12900, partial [Armatimonadetes bacterium]|nr:hypothetical protein [Armatimonadota bacterium]
MKQMELLSIRKLSTKHRKVYRMVSLLTLASMLVSISIVTSPIATAELQSAQPSEGQSDKQAQPKSPKQNQPQGQREKTGGEQRQPRQEKARKGGEASPVSEQGAIPPPPPLPAEERAQPPTGAPPAGLPPEFAGRVIRDEKIRVEFSFVKTEIEHVIQFFSKVTGKVFVLHPQLEGTVTIIAPTPLTIDQAFDVLSAVLHVRGFAMIGGIKDPIIKIVPLSEAKTQATDVRTDAQKPVAPEAKKTKEQPEHKARRLVPADRLVTQVIPLKHVSAKQLQQELTPLVSSQNALITSTTAGNLLIITDTERNVERLMQIVRMVDVGMAEAMELAIIPLKYADAQQLARILSQLFSVLGGMPMQQRQQGRQRPPGAPRPSRPQERGRQPTATPMSLQLSVQIVAEPRTNSLIVWASKERMKQVRELVKQLDVETTEVLDVEVIPLQHADATEIERILSEIFEPPTVPAGRPGSGPAPMLRMPLARPGEQPSRTALSAYATITADPRTNSLVVAATAEKMQIIKALVEKLDIDITPPIEVEIIPLKYADATSMAEIIQTLFEEGLGGAGLSPEMRTRLRIYRYYSRIRQRGGTATRSKGEMEQQVVVTADERANALVVAATRENIDRVKKIVEQLDKEFAPPVTARVFKLQYADAAQVADMLNQLFEQTPGGQRGFPFFFGMRRGVTQRERMLGLRENVVEA